MVDISGLVTSVQNYDFSSKMHLRQLGATVGTTSQLRGAWRVSDYTWECWLTAHLQSLRLAGGRCQEHLPCIKDRMSWVLLVEKESWLLWVVSGHFLTLTEQLNWPFSCAWGCLRIVVLNYFKCWTKEEWSLGLQGQTWYESASVLTIRSIVTAGGDFTVGGMLSSQDRRNRGEHRHTWEIPRVQFQTTTIKQISR